MLMFSLGFLTMFALATIFFLGHLRGKSFLVTAGGLISFLILMVTAVYHYTQRNKQKVRIIAGQVEPEPHNTWEVHPK